MYPARMSSSSAYYGSPPAAQSTVNCPYCTLLLSYPPGASLIRCPACEQTSQLTVMPQLHVPCIRCHTLLSYFPHYALIQCPSCHTQMRPPTPHSLPSVPLSLHPNYSYQPPPHPHVPSSSHPVIDQHHHQHQQRPTMPQPQLGPTIAQLPPERPSDSGREEQKLSGKTGKVDTLTGRSFQLSQTPLQERDAAAAPPAPLNKANRPSTSLSSASTAPTSSSSSSSSTPSSSSSASASSTSTSSSSRKPKSPSLVSLLSGVRISSPPPSIHPSHFTDAKASDRRSPANAVDLHSINPVVGDYSALSSSSVRPVTNLTASTASAMRSAAGDGGGEGGAVMRRGRVDGGFEPLEEESSVAYRRYEEEVEGEGDGQVDGGEREQLRGQRERAEEESRLGREESSLDYEPSVYRNEPSVYRRD